MLPGSSQAIAGASPTFDQGLKAARSGELGRAIDLWTKTIKRRPACYAAYINRGTAYMLRGDVMKAIADWHRARRYAPVFAFGVYPGDFIDQARSEFTLLNYVKATEIDPDHIPSVSMTGITYTELGKGKKAAELYRMCIDLTRNPMLKSRLEHWISGIEGGAQN